MNDEQTPPSESPSVRGLTGPDSEAAIGPPSSGRELRAPPPPAPLPAPRHELPVQELVGGAKFVRIMVPGKKGVVVRRRAGLSLDKTGRCFIVRGVDGAACGLEPGASVKVAVGRVEGDHDRRRHGALRQP